MKNINLTLCVALMLICLFRCGCDVQDVLQPTQLIETLSAAEPTVLSPVPDVIFKDVMAKRREDLMMVLKEWDAAGDEPGGWMSTAEGVVPVTKKQILERKLKGVPIEEYSHLETQKAFYTKYINAEGIAIVANAGVTDAEMIDARTVLLTMTSKHPHLRDRLQMKHGFYMILLAQETWGWDIPEVLVVAPLFEVANSCSISSTGLWIDSEGYWQKPLGVYGFCYARLSQSDRFSTFVHEFAHALDREMELLDPDFQARVRLAHEQSNLPWAEQLSWYEYWAVGVEYWFYNIGHDRGPFILHDKTYEEFFQREPLLAELLDKWFPRISFLNLDK